MNKLNLEMDEIINKLERREIQPEEAHRVVQELLASSEEREGSEERERSLEDKSFYNETLFAQSVDIELPLKKNEKEIDCLVVFGTDDSFIENIKNQSGVENIKLVRPANEFRSLSEDVFEINIHKQGDYEKVFGLINIENFSNSKIILFWPDKLNNGTMEDMLENSLYAAFYMSRELIALKPKGKIQILCPYKANQPAFDALAAFGKTLKAEYPRILLKAVRCCEDSPHIVQIISNELLAQDEETEIMYKDGKRWGRKLEELDLTSYAAGTSPLEEYGVYVITGGVGGLGMIFARHLASVYKAKLILSGRSDLDSDKLSKIKELEAKGAEVLYVKGDVSKRQDAESLINQVVERFGKINGIIHSAGLTRDSFIIKKNREEMETVLAPKVYGTIYLDDITKNHDLDFFMMFSSVSGVTGNIGQCDYSYANSFMDSFARVREQKRQNSERKGRTISINWPLWKEGGMHVDTSTEKFLFDNLGLKPLVTDKGIKAFELGLKMPVSQFLVAEGDINRIKQKLNINPGQTKTAAAILQQDIDRDGMKNKLKTDIISGIMKILGVNEDDIDIETNLSDFGFDSVTFTEFSNYINGTFNINVVPSVFFEYSTVESLCNYLIAEQQDMIANYYGSKVIKTGNLKQFNNFENNKPVKRNIPRFIKQDSHTANTSQVGSRIINEPVAIVGICGVMPQSDDLEEFWSNLVSGKDMISEIPSDRWDWREYYGDPATEDNKTNIKWGGFMKEIDGFDAAFFGISPHEAELMDPQQRLFMEAAWKAIEDAGYKAADFSGTKTGVFVGAADSGYVDMISKAGMPMQAHTSTGNGLSILANRVSYLLNLNGPSVTLDTACSSSLVAIHLAMEAIRNNDCEAAIAGGVNALVIPEIFVSFNKAGMLSTDGRCKTFDKSANGYVRGEGVGAVLLKPLSKAQRDGDHIYAVIKGSAVNHGGRANSLTAPNPNAQADLIVSAWEKSQIDPSTITYIEAHGTGTSLGDPIEIRGLKKAFEDTCKTDRKTGLYAKHCAVGSVKSNIGHLETAAGIAGLLKVLLSMKHGIIPGNLHFKELNPYINLDESPMYITAKNMNWNRLTDGNGDVIPRRAGISSFGFGGTNAHLVVEEHNLEAEYEEDMPSSTYLIVLSAKNEGSLKKYSELLAEYIDKNYLRIHSENNGKLKEINEDIYNDLTGIISQMTTIDTKELNYDENLYDMGFDNVLLSLLCEEIKTKYNKEINFRSRVESLTIRSIAGMLCGSEAEEEPTISVADVNADNVKNSNQILRRISYTLQTGREQMDERLAFFTSDLKHMFNVLKSFCNREKEIEGLLTGNVKANRDKFRLILEDIEGKDYIMSYIKNRNLLKMAKLWVEGFDIDWRLLYSDSEKKPRKTPLPTYPFDRKKYWISDNKNKSFITTYSKKTRALHSLIDENISDLKEQKYLKTFYGEEYFLKDHIVMNNKVLPGAAYLEVMVEAGKLASGNNVEALANVQWIKPLIYKKPGHTLKVSLKKIPNKAILCTVYSMLEENRWEINSQAKLHFDCEDAVHSKSTKYININNIKSSFIKNISIDEYYRQFESAGLSYGAYMRPIKELLIKDHEVIAKLEFIKTPGIQDNGFILNPALLDGAFQTVMAILRENGHAGTDLFLPFGIEKLSMFEPLKDNCIVYAKMSQNKNIDNKSFDLTIADENGLVLVEIRGFTLRRLNKVKNGSRPEKASIKTVITGKNVKVNDSGNESVLSRIREDISVLVTEILKIAPENISFDSDMSEFGFDSISITEFTNKINSKFSLEITPANFFEYTTLESLSNYLNESFYDKLKKYYKLDLEEKPLEVLSDELTGSEEEEVESIGFLYDEISFEDEEKSRIRTEDEPVAVIGISGVLPMSEDMDEFWKNLEEGKCLISEVPQDRWNWQEYYGDPSKEINKTNVKWGGFINNIDKFDNMFFGISPLEAEFMDPQQRIFLETVWKTIEDSGYRAKDLSGRKVGVFVGIGTSDYNQLLIENGAAVQAQISTGNAHSIASNRISYFFNFHGPSESIDTACSSSLITIHRAVESIRNGECEMAVAGGVNAMLTPAVFISFSKAGMLCEDGRCKTFDKDANGYVRGEGAGAVLLKPLSRAKADGDHIYAVIKGSSVNHGGRVSALTVPNPNAQAEVIKDAWKKSGIDPATISYIEAHGTGTSLGDPIEINGLIKAFKEACNEQKSISSEDIRIGVGSVKTNIGHLETAAGIASVLKVILSIKNKKIPASINFSQLNPYIKLEGSPFFIVDKQLNLDNKTGSDGSIIPFRAGVSSFGFGGTNAHVVIEEYLDESKRDAELKLPHLIILSAKTGALLKDYAIKLKRFCNSEIMKSTLYKSDNTETKNKYGFLRLSDIAYTLHNGREAYEERIAVITDSFEDLCNKLDSFIEGLETQDVIYGNIKSNKRYEKLIGTKEWEKFMTDLIDNQRLDQLADLWVSGVEIDWTGLYKSGSVRKVSLPTYPFSRERFWIQIKNEIKSTQPDKISYEMIEENVSDTKDGTLIEAAEKVSGHDQENNMDENGILQKVEEYMMDLLLKSVCIKREEIDLKSNISSLGLDSLSINNILTALNTEIGISVNPLRLMESSIEELSSVLYSDYEDEFKGYFSIDNEL